MMSKKDFIHVANHLRQPWAKEYLVPELREILSNAFGTCSPRFNSQRFWDYVDGKCASGGGEIKKSK